jgi:hypothetical protein
MLTAVTGLPGWARLIVLFFALPGICLIGLSLLMFAASIATLLLLTVPVYVLLRRVAELFAGGGNEAAGGKASAASDRNSKRIEATVVEVGPTVSKASSAPAGPSDF